MSLANPNTPVSQQDLQDFYHKLLPYMGGSFGMIANKFSKGDMYSTDEKMIGQWVDGKPLYQKTIEVGTLTQASQESYISLNTPNVDKLIKHDGVYFTYSDNNEFEAVFHLANSRGYMCPYKNYANNSLYMAYKLTFDISNVFVTVQYTKTTDSVISIGDDTDYSTEEKIVGTWIDGKPLYQRTVTFQTTQVGNNSYPHGIANIDKVYKADVFLCYDGSGIYTMGNISNGAYQLNGYAGRTTVEFNLQGSSFVGATVYATIQYTKTT